MDKIRILFLLADPSDSSRLRLGEELRDIREKLQLSKGRENFFLESRESVRPRDITQAIFDIEPQIVHFSGHGVDTGELYFENLLGKTQPVKPDALSNLFELIADQVKCVILNACYSEEQAKAIARHIPFVVGMNKAIGDKAAIAFAVGFYKALGAGRSFADAYKFACVEIHLEGFSEYLTPVLYVKNEALSSNYSLKLEETKSLKKNQTKIFSDSSIKNSKVEGGDYQRHKNSSKSLEKVRFRVQFLVILGVILLIGNIAYNQIFSSQFSGRIDSPDSTYDIGKDSLIFPQESPTEFQNESTEELRSARGVDYTRLQSLLENGQWREADRETSNVMLKAANRYEEGWFDRTSMAQFPCDDLRTINSLWVEHSDGHFGFSTQLPIWERFGGSPDAPGEVYDRFGDNVGWRVNGVWRDANTLNFSLEAPEGHLPAMTHWLGGGIWIGEWFSSYLGWRLEVCNILN